MTGRGKPISAFELNRVTVAEVRLLTHSLTRLRNGYEKEPFQVDHGCAAFAYVICCQVTLDGAHVDASLPIRIGRTDLTGRVVERELSMLNGPWNQPGGWNDPTLAYDDLMLPPNDSMWLDTSEQYDLYWTYSHQHFEQAYASLQGRGTEAPRLDANRLRLLPHNPGKEVSELDLVSDRMAENLARTVFGRGVMGGYVYEKGHFTFDVTPPTIRALFLAEFLCWYWTKAVEVGAEHWATLARVRNIALAARDNVPDFELERRLKQHAAPGTREWRVPEHFRDFAWQCANSGAVEDDFGALLKGASVTASESAHNEWLETLQDLARDHHAVHPLLRPGAIASDALLSRESHAALVDYFDMYSFGRQLHSEGADSRIRDRLLAFESTGEDTRALIRHLCDDHGGHPQLLRELELYWPDDAKARTDILLRYWDVMSQAGVQALAPFIKYDRAAWDDLATYMKWIGTLPGGAAQLLENRLEKQLALVVEDLEVARHALTAFCRYHLSAAQSTSVEIFENTLPAMTTRVRVDLTRNTLTLLTDAPISAQFTFTERTAAVVDAMPRPHGYYDGVTAGVTFRKPAAPPFEFHIDVPADLRAIGRTGKQLPAALKNVVASLNFASALISAVQHPQLANVGVWLDVSQTTLEAVEAFNAYHVAKRVVAGMAPSASLGAAALVAGTTASTVSAMRNVYDGYQILAGDDSPMTSALEDGLTTRGAVIRTKGVLLFTVGAVQGGAALVYGGAAALGLTVAGAGIVGIGLAAAGVIVLIIDIGLASTERFTERTRTFYTAWKSAEHQEFGRGHEQGRTLERLKLLSRLANATER